MREDWGVFILLIAVVMELLAVISLLYDIKNILVQS